MKRCLRPPDHNLTSKAATFLGDDDESDRDVCSDGGKLLFQGRSEERSEGYTIRSTVLDALAPLQSSASIKSVGHNNSLPRLNAAWPLPL